MKSLLLSFLSFLILISSCKSLTDKKLEQFALNGRITGQDSGRIVLIYMPEDRWIYDTAKIENGKFAFTGKILEPTQAELNGGNELNRIIIFLEPRKMKISFTINKPTECKITGSETQNDYDRLQKIKKPFNDRFSALRSQYSAISDSIKNSTDISDRYILEKRAKEISEQFSQTQNMIDHEEINFVSANPNSFLSVYTLSGLEGNERISQDSARYFFNKLSNLLKKSSYGKIISDDLRKKENTFIGSIAPDFKATDINQKTVTLSQFRGESVVLLDFWASWCVPCRQSIPHLKEVYKKYHSKGFEVVAVSTDFDRKPWIDAVKQDSTDIWYHIPVSQNYPYGPFTNDDIYQNYFVQMIPMLILIDRNGKIIGRWKNASKESKDDLDRLLSQVLN